MKDSISQSVCKRIDKKSIEIIEELIAFFTFSVLTNGLNMVNFLTFITLKALNLFKAFLQSIQLFTLFCHQINEFFEFILRIVIKPIISAFIDY